MKRSDITPGQVVSKVSFRDSRQGWPIMILSLDSYRRDWHGRAVELAGRDRLVAGSHRLSEVGLLTVSLAFSMNDTGESPPMDVLDFRIKAEKLRELASADAAVAALSAGKAWDDREHLHIKDADGELLGVYELLTGLQMVAGDYVELILAERQRAAQSARYAAEAEQARVANVERFNGLAGRLDELGITGYHAGSYESPSRFERLRFEDMERLLDLAESAVRANRAAGIDSGFPCTESHGDDRTRIPHWHTS